MNYKLLLILFFISLGLSGQDCSIAGNNFDWDPFKTNHLLYRPYQNLPAFDEDLADPNFILEDNNYMNSPKSSPSISEQFQLSINMLKFRISRYATNLDRDRSIRESDMEKQRGSLVQSLPSKLQGSSFQERFEVIGKVFEPNLNLSIEF